LLLGLLIGGCEAAPAPVHTSRAAMADGPVVLELFTSQGCSSCPPADRFLASLRAGDTLAGRPVIPLSFHVDYWNDLGWADPLSSARWTERQGAYAPLLHSEHGVYTPQLVIAGRADAIGSQRRDVEELIAATPATATLDASAARTGDRLRIRATPPAGARAWAAIVQDEVTTAIRRGENAGETLLERHIVRALIPVDGVAELAIAPAWGTVHIVAFAQEPGGAIVAARALP